MAAVAGSHRRAACLLGAMAGCLLLPAMAAAFPIDIPSQPTLVPAGGELATPDVEALKHQMGLLSGFGAAGLGWTITPRITLSESLTDNVLQTNTGRRGDLITMISPGVAIAGDTDRVQLRLDYQPNLQIYARTSALDALTQQLSLSGTATLVPDLLFVDVQGAAGVVDTFGGIGGIGTLGQPNLGALTSGGLGSVGLSTSRQSLEQTTSFSVSPYILHRIRDTGTVRAGLALSETSFSRLNGFAALPFATGTDLQRQSTIDENGSFSTDNNLGRLRYSVGVDASQSDYSSTGSSESENVDNQLNYALDQSIAPYGWLGWERVQYTGADRLGINGPLWGIGVTLTPNANTSIDVSYGRLSGSTSLRFNARYGITARTTLTGSYSSSITTQTGTLLQQLRSSTVANNGSLVNVSTGGAQFVANNALGVAPGVYRFDLLTLGVTSVLERDTISLSLSDSKQTPVGANSAAISEEAKTAGVSWTHLVNPNLSLTADTYISTGTPSAGIHQNSVVADLSGNYTLSETVSAFARYSFYGREASEAALSMYQDLFIVGITKQF